MVGLSSLYLCHASRFYTVFGTICSQVVPKFGRSGRSEITGTCADSKKQQSLKDRGIGAALTVFSDREFGGIVGWKSLFEEEILDCHIDSLRKSFGVGSQLAGIEKLQIYFVQRSR